MDYRIQNYRLKITLITLLILGLVIIASIWIMPWFIEPPRVDRIIKKELSLTKKQAQVYDQLIKLHREEMQGHLKELKTRKKALFDLLSQDLKNKKRVDELAQKIGEKQTQFELANFRHFAQVRALCSPEQKKKFDQLIHKVLK